MELHQLSFVSLIVAALTLCFTGRVGYAQTIVGMGTDSPNPHAVLELVAQNNNQGLLVPRLSDSNLAALATQLTARDQGLLVFAQDQGTFCYWWTNDWRILKVGASQDSSTAGGSVTPDADNDPANETITSASLETGDILRISEAGTSHDVDLSGFQKTTLPAGQVLIGNASDVATPVSISGDMTLNADGTMTITLDAVTTAKILDQAVTTAKLADDAVTKEKISSDVAGTGLSQAADGSLQTANIASGEILIGQGSGATAQVVSGDLTLAADGSSTVEGLRGYPISSTNPVSGQVLTWNGTSWEPATTSFGPLGWGHWFKGTSVPTTTNPVTAIDGDFYLKTDDDIVYYKESGSWTELGGFNQVNPVSEVNGKADSYRTPVLYIGDVAPVNGDEIGAVGDFYYSRIEEKLYYRLLDVSNNTIKWQDL